MSEPNTLPPRLFRRRRFLLWGALGLSGLAAALLVALTMLLHRSRDVAMTPEQTAEATDGSVAVLLQAREAAWEEIDAPLRVGSPLSPGWLRLKSGLAQIEFYSGATVILEGPAELRLISRMEAYCARGKLRATVPPQAQGFTIGSPELALVDRGTEFGLQVGGGGKTEVHVFQGKVELYDAGADREAKPRKELLTGQGVRLDAPGIVQPIEPNSAAFLTVRDLAEQIQAALWRRQFDWLSASANWRLDPSLIVYYPFQREQSWSRNLPDEAADGARRHDGAIIGCSWGAGRWPGKRGLEFKQVSDRVRLHVPGDFNALTLAAWVRVDALPNRFNSLMMTDGGEEAAPHWHIGNDGKIELGVQGYDRQGWIHYLTPKVFTRERLGVWTHLAVTYDRDNFRVVHYCDGAPIRELPLQLDIGLRLGDAEIGNWNLGKRRHNNPIRYFSGCMDEFMLFERALNAGEIGQLYEQGKPR
jgi:hypothetical protein